VVETSDQKQKDPAVNNKSLDLNLNGSFSNGNKEENGEVLMNMQAFSKPQQETTGVIENVIGNSSVNERHSMQDNIKHNEMADHNSNKIDSHTEANIPISNTQDLKEQSRDNTQKGILDGYKKSVSLDLNGTFSSSNKEYDGEILMNVETLSKKKPEQTEDIEKITENNQDQDSNEINANTNMKPVEDLSTKINNTQIEIDENTRTWNHEDMDNEINDSHSSLPEEELSVDAEGSQKEIEANNQYMNAEDENTMHKFPENTLSKEELKSSPENEIIALKDTHMESDEIYTMNEQEQKLEDISPRNEVDFERVDDIAESNDETNLENNPSNVKKDSIIQSSTMESKTSPSVGAGVVDKKKLNLENTKEKMSSKRKDANMESNLSPIKDSRLEDSPRNEEMNSITENSNLDSKASPSVGAGAVDMKKQHFENTPRNEEMDSKRKDVNMESNPSPIKDQRLENSPRNEEMDSKRNDVDNMM